MWNDVLDAFGKIFDRLAEFLQVIDLSFFVAGALLLAGMAFVVDRIEKPIHDKAEKQHLELETAVKKAEAEQGQAQRRLDYEKAELARARTELVRRTSIAESASSVYVEAAQVAEKDRTAEVTNEIKDLKKRRDKARNDETAQHAAVDAAVSESNDADRDWKRASATVAQAKAALEAVPERKRLVQRFVSEAPIPLVLVGIYILGLICFAIAGLPASWRKEERPFHEWFVDVLKGHGVDRIARYKQYVKDIEASTDPKKTALAKILYARLWARLREPDDKNKVKASYTHVLRYWVLRAIYRGVMIALLAFAVLYFVDAPDNAVPGDLLAYNWRSAEPWIVLAITAFVAFACRAESRLRYRYEVYDTVAAIAQADGP